MDIISLIFLLDYWFLCLIKILHKLSKINDTELKNLAPNCYSCIKLNGKKINYMTFISCMKNDYCNKAIKISVFPSVSYIHTT